MSYSRENKGQNLSFGLFSGVGLASFRIGFNRMTIIEGGASKVLWGIEGCPTFFVVHIWRAPNPLHADHSGRDF